MKKIIFSLDINVRSNLGLEEYLLFCVVLVIEALKQHGPNKLKFVGPMTIESKMGIFFKTNKLSFVK